MTEPETPLLELEELFQKVFRNLPVGAFVVQNRRFKLVNPRFREFLGYPEEKLLSMDCLEPVHPEDRNLVRENAVKYLRGESASPYEYRFISQDGTVGWAMETVIPGQFQGKRAVLGYFVNISRRKLAEQALRDSEQRYRELANSLPEIIFETDARGNVTFANRYAFDFLGYTEGDLTKGVSIFQMLNAESWTKAHRRFKQVLSGRGLKPIEYVALNKNGKPFPILVYTTPITRQNEVVGLRGIAIDITERKRTEQALRRSEEKLRLIFKSVAEGVTVTDLKGSIIEANEIALKIHGCDSRENFMGRKGLEFISERDRERWKEHMRQLLRGKSMGTLEYTLLKTDGTEFPGELVASLLRDASGKPIGFIGITRDITGQKRLRENMQFYITQITKAQEEERRRIARELHDETAQSLATLLLDIETIRRSGGNLPHETLHLLGQLRTKINSTLEGVRHFSHELRPDILDQLGLLSALELLTEEMNQQNTIKTYIEVIGSPQRLSSEAELVLFRIAQEALRNVRKHSHATEAMVRLEFTGKKVRMQVIDNGCGFEPPQREFDLVDSGKLGLVGMYERARLLDGSFTVKSEPGKGTTITVEVAT